MIPQPESFCPSAFKEWGQGEGNDVIPRIVSLSVTGAASALPDSASGSESFGSPAEASAALPKHLQKLKKKLLRFISGLWSWNRKWFTIACLTSADG